MTRSPSSTTTGGLLTGPAKTPPARAHLAADLALLGVTAIWGSTFVLIKGALAAYPALPFLAVRFGVAALAMLPVVWLGRRRARAGDLLVGAGVGVLLFAGSALQTLGLAETDASKAGFITGLSVVLVPLLVALVWRRLPAWQAAAGALLATLGLALLSLNADLALGRGDLLVAACAVVFAVYIVAVGALSPGRDVRVLTLGQLATVAVLSAAWALGQGPLPPITGSIWGAALYTGIAGTALAFLVQTAAQQITPATHTALILTAEPVFAALFAVLLAGERLSVRGWVGCAVILAGVILGALAQAGDAAPTGGAGVGRGEAS